MRNAVAGGSPLPVRRLALAAPRVHDGAVNWTIEVSATTTTGVDDDVADEITVALERHHGAISYAEHTLNATLTISAVDPEAAAAAGVIALRDAAATAGVELDQVFGASASR